MQRTNFKPLKKTTEIAAFLSTTFMFADVETSTLERIAAMPEIELCEFNAGEKIFTPDEHRCGVGFVVKGLCEVKKQKHNGSALPLNQMTVGQSFGILSVFSEEEDFPTEISAKKDSRVLFFPKETVLAMIEENRQISKNIIYFLASKVNFLNNKISTFSAENVEQKFAKYIMSEHKRTGETAFNLNMKKTADIISSGRASLYRAINALAAKCIIKIVDKKIYIVDLEGLERITK